MRNVALTLTLITFIAPWPSLGHDMVNMIERACLTSRFSLGFLTAMALYALAHALAARTGDDRGRKGAAAPALL